MSTGVKAIAAGATYTCALLETGTVKCWGKNTAGNLGDGTTTPRLTPVDVVGLSSGIIGITAGWGDTVSSGQTCAVDQNGGGKCWGENGYGEVGDGTTTNRLTPVEVAWP